MPIATLVSAGVALKAGSDPVTPARTVPVAATPKDETALEAPPKTMPCCVTALAVIGDVPFQSHQRLASVPSFRPIQSRARRLVAQRIRART